MKWGLLWRSNNSLNGKTKRIIWNKRRPLMFDTRQEARDYNTKHYGYIRERKDLRVEPHGWKYPTPVKIKVVLAEQPKGE